MHNMLDIGKIFKKLSKKQAMNKITDRMYSMVWSSKWSEKVFMNRIHDSIKFPRDLERVYDILYYTLVTVEPLKDKSKPKDFNKLSSVLDEKLRKVQLNLEGYFVSKYQLDSMLVTMVANPDMVEFDTDTRGYMSLIYTMNCFIDLCMFRSDKRVIRGVDIESNKIKYTSANMIFDLVALTFKNELDIPFYTDAIEATRLNYIRSTGKSDIDVDAVMSINDKVDDTMRMHFDSCILVDILNQKSSADIQFVKPNTKTVEDILFSGFVTAVPTSIFRTRTCMTSTRGNLIINKKVAKDKYMGVASVLIKDVMLGDCPFIALSYKTYSNDEDTVIIPLHFDSVTQTVHIEAIALALEFYGIKFFENTKFDFDILSPYYWKYRNKGYTSTGDKVSKTGEIEREYKEIEIGIHKAKMGNPSDKAKELAKKHCIELLDGETIVDTHVRHYGKKKGVNEE